MVEGTDKLEGARRLLETAIDLYFENREGLAAHSLAFSAFKVLFDLYPHRKDDDFSRQIDAILNKEGWRSMSSVANFLKHADRDPGALIETYNPARGLGVIGLATVLYRRIAGAFTLKMMAFDHWAEELGYEELNLVEVDGNADRAEAYKAERLRLRQLPYEQMIEIGERQYRFFIANYERLRREADDAREAGLTATDMLDRLSAGATID